MHGRSAIARASEAIARPHEASFCTAIERGEGLDLCDREPCERRRPTGRRITEMRFNAGIPIGEAREEVPVGQPVAEQNMDRRRRQRAVRAGLEHQMHVGLFGSAGAVRVDHDEFRAPRFPRPGHMGHEIDLGVHRIAAPDDDHVAFQHFQRVDPVTRADAYVPASLGDVHADRVVLPCVALGMAEAMNAVTLHAAHCAGVEIRKHRLGAVALLGLQQALGDFVEGVVPADRSKGVAARAARADAAERLGETVGVMDPLGIARDLRADDARRVAIALAAADLADPVRRHPLNVKRADARTVMWADRLVPIGFGFLAGGNVVERHGGPPALSPRGQDDAASLGACRRACQCDSACLHGSGIVSGKGSLA